MRLSQRQWNDLKVVDGHWRYWPTGTPHPVGPSFPSMLDALAWPELPRLRAGYREEHDPIPPVRQTRTGAPGEICLADIPVIVYTVDPPDNRKAIYESRRRRLGRVLRTYGYQSISWQFGSATIPYCARHCADHAANLVRMDAPLIELEDDAEPLYPVTHITPPAGADMVMIGCDRNGLDLARRLGHKVRKDWRRHKGFLWRFAKPGWFWTCGNLSYHGILYLSKPMMLDLAQYIVKRTGAIDASVAERHAFWSVCAPTRGLWYQNDGHNGPCTRDYCPKALRS